MNPSEDSYGNRSEGAAFPEASPHADGPLVVVVDDHEDSVGVVVYVLESIQCRHISMDSGAGLLEALRSIRPDVILLDILLPDINGLDLIDLIRREFSNLQIPIIAVTALSSAQDRHAIAQKGFTDCLIKPFDLSLLRQKLQNYLYQHQSSFFPISANCSAP
ncbi:response regulator [Lyngbya confervoides]|uniref:Response regulator n=1 Tax=Lyngbya confervoides BDU141951 TaxID=1574623 RepID=A0ABD4T0L4_9CYAN|nr:response regulator [Lyngbya confervoides]MCM1981895.1 response regulator [Lyngbya confervoides BDU141951]